MPAKALETTQPTPGCQHQPTAQEGLRAQALPGTTPAAFLTVISIKVAIGAKERGGTDWYADAPAASAHEADKSRGEEDGRFRFSTVLLALHPDLHHC